MQHVTHVIACGRREWMCAGSPVLETKASYRPTTFAQARGKEVRRKGEGRGGEGGRGR